MSDIKKINSFIHTFSVPTKDFKNWEDKELTVNTYLKDNHLLFSLTIPAYIYRKIFGTEIKYIDGFIEKQYISPFGGKKVRFKNKLQNEVFFDLIGRFEEVCQDAIQVQSVINSDKDMVILVKFSKEDNEEMDGLNRAAKGRKLSSRFQYFVCYQRHVDDFVAGKKIYVYESLEQATQGLQGQYKGYGFKRYFDNVKEGFDVISWTQEREDFFKSIEKAFIDLNGKLEEFFGKLTDDKVEKLIAIHKHSNLLPAYDKKEQEHDAN